MNKPRRIKRPELKRSEPIRSWTGMSTGGPPPAGPAPAPDRSDPAAWGARLGYGVIDDYLRRGQQAARDMWSGPALAEGMRDPRQLAGRMLQYATDLSTGWMDLVNAVMMNGSAVPPPTGQAPVDFNLGPPADRQAAAGPARPAPAPAPVAGLQLAIEVQSAKRVSVAVELDPRPVAGGLVVHALRAGAGKAGGAGGRRPRIEGVVIERAPEGPGLTVRLKVPARHPAGVYSGAIVEPDSSLPCGRVTVTVA
jgi:hypothetical protein